LSKEDRYAIGKNEEIKELIGKSEMNYILKGMSRALFFIE
jgi:hypothetical protein